MTRSQLTAAEENVLDLMLECPSDLRGSWGMTQWLANNYPGQPVTRSAICQILARLCKLGLVRKVSRGIYQVVKD